MTVHEILVAARNYLDRVGWSGNEFGPGTCTFLAPSYVGCDYPGAVEEADTALMDQLGIRNLAMGYAWNDAPSRTKAEVLALYDRAIAATAPAPAFDQLDANPASSASASTKEGVPA